MKNTIIPTNYYLGFLQIGVIFFLLYLSDLYGYGLFHILLELFSAIIIFGIFFIAVGRSREKLKKIDRAKTEFVSLASHQLRTPLSSVSLSSELLLRGIGGPLEDKQRKYLEEINNSAQKMSEIIEMLLNISRVELGTFVVRPEPLDVGTEINKLTEDFKLKIENNKLSLVKTFEKNLPAVNYDKNVLRIIMESLISNAIRYTPIGGRIEIIIKVDRDDIVIAISDTGRGISKDKRRKIFSKIFRAETKKDFDSEEVSLGLYLSKSLAEESGSKIWLESEPDKGSTFYLSIPLSS